MVARRAAASARSAAGSLPSSAPDGSSSTSSSLTTTKSTVPGEQEQHGIVGSLWARKAYIAAAFKATGPWAHSQSRLKPLLACLPAGCHRRQTSSATLGRRWTESRGPALRQASGRPSRGLRWQKGVQGCPPAHPCDPGAAMPGNAARVALPPAPPGTASEASTARGVPLSTYTISRRFCRGCRAGRSTVAPTTKTDHRHRCGAFHHSEATAARQPPSTHLHQISCALVGLHP